MGAMDHAVSLVQAYLQLNGYFTSAEYPIMAGAGRNGVRTITDIDVLAFRFPSGLPLSRGRKKPKGLDVSDLDLRMPVARTPDAWLAFGFDEDLDTAAEDARETMLDLMERELRLDRMHALALASVAVDLRVTQLVNGAKGVHAVLRDDAVNV